MIWFMFVPGMQRIDAMGRRARVNAPPSWINQRALLVRAFRYPETLRSVNKPYLIDHRHPIIVIKLIMYPEMSAELRCC